MKLASGVVFLSLILVSGIGIARSHYVKPQYPKITDFVYSEITKIESGFEHMPVNKATSSFSAAQESWELQSFLLRIRGTFELDVPVFANFTVIPEIELVWKLD